MGGTTIDRRLQDITDFLIEEFRSRGFHKAVIGLSGGIDSAVSAALLAKALGGENVTGIRMPYKCSDPRNFNDAQLLADDLGLNMIDRPITAMVDAFINADPTLSEQWKDLDKDSSGSKKRVRIGNIAARCRMITLFDHAKHNNALVAGTENKTENILGYFTRFGDAASDIECISSLYKTEVFEAAELLNLPRVVIEKSPSADLWDGQTDEGDFGISYNKIDTVLKERGPIS